MDYIKQLIGTLDGSVSDFQESMPAIQKQISSEIEIFIKDLDTTGDTIKVNVSNLRKIAAFKDRIYSIIKKSDYPEKLDKFIKSFDEVANIQNKYFESVSKKFKPTPVLKEISNQSITSAIDYLTEAGLNNALIQPVHDILLTNSTTGGSWSEMATQIRNFITANNDTVGALERYTSQVTTDSLNQYSRQYMQTVTNDLGFNWFAYRGALIKTSRTFCEACREKEFIHRSEFPEIIKGNFKEFKEMKGEIYDKTGLPQGMIDGTNPNNFEVYAGGYNCEHHLVPVSDAIVPKLLRDKFA
jgi:hypothetical protein